MVITDVVPSANHQQWRAHPDQKTSAVGGGFSKSLFGRIPPRWFLVSYNENGLHAIVLVLGIIGWLDIFFPALHCRPIAASGSAEFLWAAKKEGNRL